MAGISTMRSRCGRGEVRRPDRDGTMQTALAAHEDERGSTQRVETATERRGGEEVGSRGQPPSGLLGFLCESSIAEFQEMRDCGSFCLRDWEQERG